MTTDRGANDNGSRTLAFVALGVGGAGLALGGVTGVLALSKKSSLDDNQNCLNGECTYAVEDDVNALRTFRTISTIGFIAGGALAATGVVLLLTSNGAAQSGRRPAASLALALSPGELRLRGSF